ncbi:DMT family transporter [Dongia soli]|uniref:DMT family transporter n=1 Tax=Dongia soli TaxID=600628 RepID=A0ABU5E5F3_9PROT|nr:DMT family transporter [Dongia soli]MDY0881369.1 DMT family transporter [Dongia soli]
MSTGLLYFLVVLIWGSSWIGIEYQLGVVAPELSIAYRFLLSSVMLAGFCLATRRSLRFSWRAHLLMAAQGLTLFCLNYLMFYWSAGYLTSGLMAIVFSTMTVMNLINGAILFRHPIDRRVGAGALLGLIGLSCVFWPEIAGFDASSTAMIGLLLSLAGTFLASLGNMVSVKLKAEEIPVIQSNTIGMAYGAIGSLLLAVIGGASFAYDPHPSYSISLFMLALFASVIGFTCYLTLVQRLGAGQAAYTTVLFPIVALGISTFVENYHWTILAVIGIALVLCGNLLVLRRRGAVRLRRIGSPAQS